VSRDKWKMEDWTLEEGVLKLLWGRTPKERKIVVKLEIAAQGVAQCKVSATHVVVDAALRHI